MTTARTDAIAAATPPPAFDLYDQGLQADVATLVDRRRVLQLISLAGVGAVLAACTPGASATASAIASAAASPRRRRRPRVACAPVIPEETAGPFPGDGTNGPDVLTDSGVVRSDITHELRCVVRHGRGHPADDPPSRSRARRRPASRWPMPRSTSGTATARAGTRSTRRAPRTRTTCAASRRPAPTASSRSRASSRPATRAAGRTSTSRSTRRSPPRRDAGNKIATSQIALPKGICDQVYATAGYEQSVSNLGADQPAPRTWCSATTGASTRSGRSPGRWPTA